MTPEQLEQVKRIFIEAKKRPTAERRDYIDAACQGLPEIRAEVLELLEATPVADPVPEETRHRTLDAEGMPQSARCFDRFEIISSLGVGGMGMVDLAYDPRLERLVALKRVRPEMLASETLRTRFKREALATSKLDHPGLCPVYEVGETEGTPYFVMPVIEGHTLAADLASAASQSETSSTPTAGATTALPISESTRILAVMRTIEQVARALHHAHEVGLVHRDVKPANIMIREDGNATVLDFGLVQDTEASGEILTATGQQPGTPLYMSPEQIHGTMTKSDRRTDVYSLGVSLFEATTLRLPFEAGTQHELFDKVRNSPPPDPRKLNRFVPRELSIVIQVAMDKDPARRYQTAKDFADDLQAIQRSEPIRARRVGYSLRLQRWVLRHPRTTVALCTLTAGLLISSYLWFDSAAIAGQMAILESQEEAHRENALRQLNSAETTLQDFNSLAARVKLDNALAAAAVLYPAWSQAVPGLEAWQANHGEPLRAQLAQVQLTLKRLEDSTLVDSRSASEKADQLRARASTSKKLNALEHAMEVRTGKREFKPVALPESAPNTIEALREIAWPLIDPNREADAHGQEALGFAYAMRASEMDTTDALTGYVLAWAAFATGIDRARGITNMFAGDVQSAPDGQPLNEYSKRMFDALHAAHDVLIETRLRFEQLDADRPQFASKSQLFLHNTLRGVETDLVAALSDRGIARDIEIRLTWARSIPDLTERHPNARSTWKQAAAAIALADDRVASKLYAAQPIVLKPQAGLIPIGMNPVTKLWEFYHLRSAFDPRSNLQPKDIPIPVHQPDGTIAVQPESGIVFVLIPGGQLTRDDPDNKSSETRDAAGKTTVRKLSIEPFFAARHELTQGQWIRLSGQDNPSRLSAGNTIVGQRITLLFPVSSVSWDMCHTLLSQHGLQLPGEWQWEYACSGGTTTPWAGAQTIAELEGKANILDESAHRVGISTTVPVPFDDGFSIHAPIGTFPSNGFGLHEVTGNVREWCADLDPHSKMGRVVRGGSFVKPAQVARLRYRTNLRPLTRGDDVGLRPIRTIR